jgi:hypothetical protein
MMIDYPKFGVYKNNYDSMSLFTCLAETLILTIS